MTDEQIKEIMALVEQYGFECWNDGGLQYDFESDDTTQEALTAIESALRAAVPAIPAGWRLVPVDPTEAMYVAGDDAAAECRKSGLVPAGEVYRAMLSASPQAPQAATEADAELTAMLPILQSIARETVPLTATEIEEAESDRGYPKTDATLRGSYQRVWTAPQAAQPTGAVINTDAQGRR